MAVSRALLTVAVVLLALVIAAGAVGLGLPPAAGILLVAIVVVPVVGQFVLAGLTRPAGAAPALDATVARLRLLRVKAETYLDEGIAEAERLVKLEGRDAQVADELARLYARAGRTEEARRAAGMAIERALAAGQAAVAADVVRRSGDRADALGLRPALLEKLGWALVQSGDFDTAAWAFDTLARGAAAGTDAERVHKGLVGVADAAAAAGHTGRALAIYRTFLERHPSASLAAYVRNAVARLERPARPGRPAG
jgi:tetratricopeptide (TPR) repeat protein